MRISSFFIICITIICSAHPAFAASKKELEAKIIQLEQRLGALEQRMLTGDPAAERLMQRMDALETSQRTMTGEIERLRYESETLHEELRALASQIVSLQTISEAMELHLKAVEIVAQEQAREQSREQSSQQREGQSQPLEMQGGTNAPIVYGETGVSRASGIYSGGSSFPPPPKIGGDTSSKQGEDSSDLALIGQGRMNEGDFSGAQSAFLQYLDLKPDAQDKGDVYFLLGETYFANSGFSKAAEAYIASMRAEPNGDYAPEAMVKLASTARSLGKTNMACQTLASFPSQYPNAVAAVVEKARVEKIRSGC